MARGFDLLEAAKVAPQAAPPPPPTAGAAPTPTSVPTATNEQLEKARHELEGTPAVVAKEPAPVQVAPPQPPKPRPGRYYRVTKSQIVNFGGNLTTLAKGSIVSEYSHDLETLVVQKVEWEPIDPC